MRTLIRKFEGENQYGKFYGCVFAGSLIGNTIIKGAVEYLDEDVWKKLEVGQAYKI